MANATLFVPPCLSLCALAAVLCGGRGSAQTLCAVPDAELLAAVRKAWQDHKTSQLMIRDILMYLNSVYVPPNNVLGVYEMGLVLFREHVAREPQLKRRLLEQLLALVARERAGEVVDRSVLKSATGMLVELGCGHRDVYVADFERAYLETTARTLHEEAAARLATDGAPAYLAFADRRLNEELARVKQVRLSALVCRFVCLLARIV